MLAYILFMLFQGVIRFLPISLLYVCADILSWSLRVVFNYRRDTIDKNLATAYPELTSKAQKGLVKAIYNNLADTMLESLKGPYLKSDDLKRRMKFINPELLPEQGDAILIGGHQGNWEWGGLAVSLWFDQDIAGVYKPMKNKRIDQFFKHKRKQWGLNLFSMRETSRFLSQKIRPAILVLIADQSPGNARTAIWTNFFNQKAAFNVGPEKIAKAKNWPVYFYTVKRIRRGYYEVSFELLAEKPDELSSGAITLAYKNALEKSISEQPADWLWSHKRWKKVMPKNVQFYS